MVDSLFRASELFVKRSDQPHLLAVIVMGFAARLSERMCAEARPYSALPLQPESNAIF